MVIVTIAYFAISTGLVPAATVMPPWVTPPIIGGVLAAVNLLVSVLIYLPFIKIATDMALKEEAARDQAA